MLKVLKFFAFIGFSIFFISDYADQKLSVRNLKPVDSEIHVALFKTEMDFPENPIHSFSFESIEQQEQVLYLKEIEKGDYLIAIFQDIDKNQELNKNWVGLPTEPYGFSNNMKPSILGIPFQKGIVKVPCGNTITIDLRH
ncbi:MAG: DUF2141 domain-containing protein [Bacteroidota bacterium]